MAVNIWIGATGSQNWSTAGNWSLGAAPVSTNDVFILNGSSDINLGLAQSAVTLASLTIGTGFTGTIGESAATGASLDIGITLFKAIAAQSNAGGFLSGGFTRFKWNPGTVDYTAFIQATGTSQDVGFGALQIKNGNTASSLSMTGGSVDVATRPGNTAVLPTLNIDGGTCFVGSGTTLTTVNQNNGLLVLNGAATTVLNIGGTLYTYGVGLIGTLKIGGQAFLGHRAAADSITTLTMFTGGNADFTIDPRSLLITNNVIVHEGAVLKAFNAAQVKKTGPAALIFAPSDCAMEDFEYSCGPMATVTVA